MRLLGRLLSLMSLLLVGYLSFGQQLKLSPEEYIDLNQRSVKVLGTVGDKTACFLENYEGYRILWYDSAMRKVATSKLDFLERGARQFRFYVKRDVIHIFYQRKKRKKLTLWAAKVVPLDKDTIVPLAIDSIELRGGWDKQRFDLYNTSHNERVAYSTSSYDQKKGSLQFEVVSLDEHWNQIQRVKESLTDVPFHMLLDVEVDQHDGLHVFFGEPSRQERKWQKVLVGSKSKTSENLQYHLLKLDGLFLADPTFQFVEGEAGIHLGGLLYQSGTQGLHALGHFVYNTTTQDWQSSLVVKTPDENEGKSTTLDKVQLRNFILKKDGGATFILEHSYIERHQRNRSMGMMPPGVILGGSTYNVYHDDEIHAISTNNKGAIDWYEILMKTQESSDANGRFQSFGLLQYAVGNVFLFNDQQNSTNRFITAFLSNTGELKLRQFSSPAYQHMEEDNMLLRSARQTAANEVVFPVLKRGALSFAKIVF